MLNVDQIVTFYTNDNRDDYSVSINLITEIRKESSFWWKMKPEQMDANLLSIKCVSLHLSEIQT